MKALIVVDMQNDFIDGSLGTKEARGIVDKVAKRILAYKFNNEPVIFTRDTHTKDYLNTQEGRNLPIEHCIEGTKGWEISRKLDISGSIIINKPTFGSLELINYLKQNYKEFEEIELVGLCTDICVISNAMILKAAFLNTIVSVNASLCAGVTVKSHKNALESMKMCQINVID